MADQIYYHIKASGTGTSVSFFNTNEGASGEVVTNLPATNMVNKNFTVRKLVVQPSSDLTRADLLKLVEGAVVKLTINKDEVIKMPLVAALGDMRFSTEGTVASNEIMSVGQETKGYEFSTPVMIPANTSFEVKIVLEAALGASTDMICMLYGDEK
mgnify:CR=1 FL=1